jgi:hypothetical protein
MILRARKWNDSGCGYPKIQEFAHLNTGESEHWNHPGQSDTIVRLRRAFVR